MMKILKNALNTLTVAIVIIVLLQLFLDYICPYSPSQTEITAEFERSKDLINEVAEILLTPGADDVYISRVVREWECVPENPKGISIDEKDRIIDIARKRKYSIIGKNDKYIFFQLWENLDSAHGFAYPLIDGHLEMQYLTKCVPLSQKNWYYYETDVNEYRKMRERGEVSD